MTIARLAGRVPGGPRVPLGSPSWVVGMVCCWSGRLGQGGDPLPGGDDAAGRKSDHGDAVVLANILRTDLHAHRPLPADSELAQAIAVLARAQQDAVWDRVQAHNRLRSH